MLGSGEYISVVINLLVAAYLIYFYPHHARRQFQNRPLPPSFRILATMAPAAGYLLAAMTVIYVTLRLTGIIPS